jgi:uncharacterized protein YbcV (DUF1398 family)
MDAVAVMEECQELSRQGKITFPEVVRRLSDAGVERYHVDLTRGETTYYLSGGESHVFASHGPAGDIGGAFDASAVERAVRASQRGEIIHPEFLARIRAAGCVGYFAQLAGRKVQYVGRAGDMHVEAFPAARD